MDRTKAMTGPARAQGVASVASLDDAFARLQKAREAARQLEADSIEIKRRAVARLSELEMEVFAAEVRAEEAEARATDARDCLARLADTVARQLAGPSVEIADRPLARAA